MVAARAIAEILHKFPGEEAVSVLHDGARHRRIRPDHPGRNFQEIQYCVTGHLADGVA